ncbi:hypothetical protein VC87395_001755 [Vibrio paracholerae 87395]|nr:hypothetical protein VC87395_001755 [Vibrio paracholerae 87395]
MSALERRPSPRPSDVLRENQKANRSIERLFLSKELRGFRL